MKTTLTQKEKMTYELVMILQSLETNDYEKAKEKLREEFINDDKMQDFLTKLFSVCESGIQ